MKKILLVDGNLLLFRSFYAAQSISKIPGNLPTHLFLNSIIEIIKDENPEFLFIAFDAHGKTKRHALFEQYKANRTKPPEELYIQKKIIIEILSIMNITNYEQIGEEADDLIATICEKFKNDNNIFILSEDKDLLQLVDMNVSIIQKNKNKKINQKYLKININNFNEFFSISPQQIIDYKAIAGDNSDNLIGIKGIGEKTAITLLNKFGTIENIYNNLERLTEKQRNLFISNKEISYLCKNLAKLNRNIDLTYSLEDLKIELHTLKNQEVKAILEKYNLKKIWTKLNELDKIS